MNLTQTIWHVLTRIKYTKAMIDDITAKGYVVHFSTARSRHRDGISFDTKCVDEILNPVTGKSISRNSAAPIYKQNYTVDERYGVILYPEHLSYCELSKHQRLNRFIQNESRIVGDCLEQYLDTPVNEDYYDACDAMQFSMFDDRSTYGKFRHLRYAKQNLENTEQRIENAKAELQSIADKLLALSLDRDQLEKQANEERLAIGLKPVDYHST